MKVVINTCWGGFGLSEDAAIAFARRKGFIVNPDMSGFHHWEYPEDRADPDLVQIVEEMGKTANASLTSLKVVEIPDGIEYEIYNYDGKESIHEKHRVWD